MPLKTYFPRKRVYYYVNIILFKILFEFRKSIGVDIYNVDANSQNYNNLMSKLEIFQQLFLTVILDDRILQNPSQRYRNLEQEITEMSENPNLSESEIFILHQKEDQLDILRIQEINNESPFQPNTERVNSMENLYGDIINDESLETVKNILNQVQGVSLSSRNNIIDKYLGQHLLNNLNVYDGRNDNEKAEITRLQFILRLEQFYR